MFHRSWEIKKYDYIAAEKIQEEMGLSRITAQLLIQRGIHTIQEAKQFLYPDWKDLSDPLDIGGMQNAVERIEGAVAAGEKIVIYGDYDADGVCSTVLLMECLFLMGARPAYYIPDRFNEGYGLNREAIEKLSAQGCKLIITVDCGIASTEEVDFASRLGVEVIITDHHTPVEILPAALAIINPRLDNKNTSRDLAGAGVAFKLATALCKNKIPEEQISDWLDLVALATVADIVPLRGENRIMVRKGLEKLRLTKRPGLIALLKETGLAGKVLSSWQLGFVLGPRLNSAGRMDNARTSVDLLLVKEEAKAAEMAQNLCRLNDERRLVEEGIYQEALLQAANSDLEKQPALVLAAENWHQGVIGIVASRLVEKFRRPVILISWEGENGRGSARSISSINIYDVINECRAYLNQFGGHKMAAGLSMERKNFTAFKDLLLAKLSEVKDSDSFSESEVIFVDAEIEAGEINDNLLNELRLLEPFGEGNPVPRFVLPDAGIEQATLVGRKREHFKAQVEPGNLKGIAFNKAQFIELPFKHCNQDLLFELGEEEFRGQKSISLKLQEITGSFLLAGENLPGEKSSEMAVFLDKSLHELEALRPVLLIYPTCRSLNQHLAILGQFFRPQILHPIHGMLAANKRMKELNEFLQGRSKIFLITQAFLRYLLKSYELPGNLHYIARAWPREFSGENDELGRHTIDSLDDLNGEVIWKQVKWEYDGCRRTVIYANRAKTIQRLTGDLTDVFVETGLKSSREKRELRRRFREAKAGLFFTDLAWGEMAAAGDSIDEFIFGDMPFSIYEARSVLEYIKPGEVQARVLFSMADLDFYRSYLQQLYPDLQRLRTGLAALKKMGKNPIRSDLDILAERLTEFCSWKASAHNLLPILRVLADLGLCQVKKKGSIIEIQFNSTATSILDISASPFYMEGLAEKKAFAQLEAELNKYLEW